jgi:alkaline phosphatase
MREKPFNEHTYANTLPVVIIVSAVVHPLGACYAGSPVNIILFVGDGMGIAHVTAAKITRGSLHIERLRTGGFVMTNAEDELVTDSAASGTAMATGHKTYNGAISVSSSGEPLKTVLEYAEESGRSTGLVVTCSITHATPAVFAAHVLMVEGSQIDWAGHERDSGGIIAEMADFDEAIGVGMDFAERDGGTLVIVTSDHETGGFAVHAGSVADSTVAESGFTCGGHTAEMVPLFAFGPGSEVFGGILDNTDIGRIMIEFMRDR